MSTQEKKEIIPQNSQDKLATSLIKTGIGLIGFSLLLFILIFYPTLQEEFTYLVNKPSTDVMVSLPSDAPLNGEVMVPVDTDFGIVIPKIGANARIIENINPYNSIEYQVALTKGVAHAKGSSTPELGGNTFLFAHSSDNFYNANRYNSVFYLIRKLEIGDEIIIFQNETQYEYLVTETLLVEPEAIEYLSPESQNPKLTLMTCWPPGTTLKRLVVIGEIKNTL